MGSHPNDDTYGIRYIGEPIAFLNLFKEVAQFSTNPALGNESIGFGDSGGPLFYKDPLSGIQIQITTVSTGNPSLTGEAVSPILDLPDNLAFVKCGKVVGDVSKVKECVDGLGRN